MTITELLAPIKERLEKATPGPYAARVREFSNHALCEVWTELGWYKQLPKDYREPTTELFSHAPTDLARLIKVVEVMSRALETFAANKGAPPASKDAYTKTLDAYTYLAKQARAEAAKILRGEG